MLLGVIRREYLDLERELELLIREARRRQRRRRRARALIACGALAVAGAATGAVSGQFAKVTGSGGDTPRSAAGAGARCPTSPASFVSNATFAATVIGNGRVRLGVGNVYETTRRRVVVYHHAARSWGGIEAIWWVARSGTRGPITVRGVALGKQGPFEVQPSGGGQAPGVGSLTLPAPSPLFPGSTYPGSLWVRTGGCYAVDISGRGFHERIVFDVRTSVT